MKNKRHEVGKWGEQTAAHYLVELGYRILCRNFSSPGGEIDLVAELEAGERTLLIFVEVKTRTSLRYGYPEEAITDKKWKSLMLAIDEYLYQHPPGDCDWQVDVIAIKKNRGAKPPEIKHFENVVMRDEQSN